MLAALITVALVQPLSLFVVARYLRHRDELERSERADLHQRIQAPDTAVATHVVQATAQPVQHLPFEDDQAFQLYQTEFLSGQAG